MYVILTTKPGQFRTEPSDELKPRETYDYFFYGLKKARFVIAELQGPAAVCIIDETVAGAVNKIPSKLLPSFDSIEAARAELGHLTSFGQMDTRLERVL